MEACHDLKTSLARLENRMEQQGLQEYRPTVIAIAPLNVEEGVVKKPSKEHPNHVRRPGTLDLQQSSSTYCFLNDAQMPRKDISSNRSLRSIAAHRSKLRRI
jgi:hypothetical protein